MTSSCLTAARTCATFFALPTTTTTTLAWSLLLARQFHRESSIDFTGASSLVPVPCHFHGASNRRRPNTIPTVNAKRNPVLIPVPLFWGESSRPSCQILNKAATNGRRSNGPRAIMWRPAITAVHPRLPSPIAALAIPASTRAVAPQEERGLPTRVRNRLAGAGKEVYRPGSGHRRHQRLHTFPPGRRKARRTAQHPQEAGTSRRPGSDGEPGVRAATIGMGSAE